MIFFLKSNNILKYKGDVKIVVLTPLETLQGALTLAFVLISTFLGLFMILKYIKFKQRQLFLVGITWILLVSPYWPDAITFIMVLLTGAILDNLIYFFLANALIPLVHITWSIAFSDFLLKKERKKIFVAIITVEAIIFEVIFLSLLFIDLSLIGTRMAPFYVKWTDFIVFYLLFSIVMFLVMGIFFVRECLKSENREIRLKGKFLLVAFITFSIGTVIDAVGMLTELTLVLARTFVIIAAINFYIGFTLPKFIKEIFFKED